MMRARRTMGIALGVMVLLAACSDDDGGSSAGTDDATADEPTAEVVATDAEVTLVPGPPPANPMPDGLAEEYGYVEEEYVVGGEATAYAPVGELSTDGFWTVEAAETAPYTTRVVVRRPEDPDDFNGTVIVEWFNVTAGIDADPDFGLLNPVLLGDGYAYVGVSAQKAGIDGGAAISIPGVEGLAQPLKELDPERYGELSHPGDDWSYDIVSQVGQAAGAGALLDGTVPDQVILIGESQSAFRMTTYINGVHPVADVYDGFLVHSRNSTGAPLAGGGVMGTGAVTFRTDLDVPILQFETETDLVGLGFLAARQPDTDRIVTWEVAGAAHADASLLEYGEESTGQSVDFESLCGQINTGPQREVLRAALVAVTDWVVDGTAPPTGELIDTNGEELARDELGIVTGGIRTPDVDAPAVVLSGENSADSVICSLFGETRPLTPEQLAEMYPMHEDYVDAVTEAADAAVEAGFLLPADRDAVVEEAEAAPVPD